LRAPGGVVYMLDFEDTRRGLRARLRDLGCADDELARFYYASPSDPLTPASAEEVAAFVAGAKPGLVVLDGVNAAMNLNGMDINDNNDVTRFTRHVLRPLAAHGAAVLTIDHVTKSKDSRG